MTAQQPEALRLADWLDHRTMKMLQDRQAVAELRRLHAVEQQRDELLARLDIACEVQIISSTYDRTRAEQVFAIDDIEYDLFAAGWKAAIAAVKGGAA